MKNLKLRSFVEGKGKREKGKIALTQFCLEDSTERSESNP